MSNTSHPASDNPDYPHAEYDTGDAAAETPGSSATGLYFVKIYDPERKRLHKISLGTEHEDSDILTAVLKAASQWGNKDRVFSEPHGKLLRVQLFKGRMRDGYSACGQSFTWRVRAQRTWAFSAIKQLPTPTNGSCTYKGKGGPCLLNHSAAGRWCGNCKSASEKLRGIS